MSDETKAKCMGRVWEYRADMCVKSVIFSTVLLFVHPIFAAVGIASIIGIGYCLYKAEMAHTDGRGFGGMF